MHINIISRDAYKRNNRILGRLAQSLADDTGWAISNTPDPTADLNYFFPYLEVLNHLDFTETPTAAWFTHKDTYQKGKAELWDKAARAVHLRTTTVRQNMSGLSEFGSTVLVTPPLDRDKFKPNSRRVPADVPVVGTSGWVYQGGRKGAGLLKKLANSKLPIHLVACGHGWPVRCHEIPWEKLETFYQGLDLYVCTSLLEGVGYGPLEALACQVPVVIPYGVGVFDDLPMMPGIFRYQPGSINDLKKAVVEAISVEYRPEDRQALREAVAGYTRQGWAEAHQKAFETLIDPPRPVEELPDWRGNSGVYYVAFGKPSRNMARQAIPSFKEYVPDVPAAFVSTKPLEAGEDVFIKQPDKDIGGRIAKIKMYDLAPKDWHYVLYLDADTEIVEDVSVLFQFLADGWELVICKNPGKYHMLREMVRPDNKDEADYTFATVGKVALQLNGGVLAFRRNERVKRFFDLWIEEWNRWGKRDQAALHRALWRQPLRVYVLGNEWNTVTRYDDPAITAGILHYPTTARRWTGRIDGRLDSEEAWQAVQR